MDQTFQINSIQSINRFFGSITRLLTGRRSITRQGYRSHQTKVYTESNQTKSLQNQNSKKILVNAYENI